MNKSKLITIVLGIILILLAPTLGFYLSHIYLLLIGGMETEKFLLIMDGCINGFQIIGLLSVLYGVLKKCKKQF